MMCFVTSSTGEFLFNRHVNADSFCVHCNLRSFTNSRRKDVTLRTGILLQMFWRNTRSLLSSKAPRARLKCSLCMTWAVLTRGSLERLSLIKVAIISSFSAQLPSRILSHCLDFIPSVGAWARFKGLFFSVRCVWE